MTLVEATGKKTRFLESTRCALNLQQVAVVNQRVETLGHDAAYRDQFDVVLARAVGSLAELVELGMPLLRVGGSLLAYKGAQAQQEIDQAAHAMKELKAELTAVHDAPCPGREASVLVEIRKKVRTPGRYPRRPGVPKKTPL
jgi:16S rRNA (guanine527-N7)-methyltransferase